MATGLLVFLAWFLMLRPAALGGPATYSIVSGHSMEPTLQPGDYVIARAQDDYDVGDIVMFEVPGGVVIHRIVSGSADTGFTTRGDNNVGVDPWQPAGESILGEAWVHVPELGRLIAVVRGPVGIGIMAGLLTSLGIMRMTTPRGRHRAPSSGAEPRRSAGWGRRTRSKHGRARRSRRDTANEAWLYASPRPGRL